jgi:HlyD family secretion protein
MKDAQTMKRSYVIGGPALFIILAAGVYFFLAANNNNGAQFRFDKVSRGDVEQTVTATGTLSAVTTIDIGTQVSGIIAKLYVDFNARVKKNQVLAMIDTTTLQQSVREADASRQGAQAEYNNAKRALDRISELFNKNLASQAEYDSALTTFESDKAALTQAQAGYDKAVTNLHYATIRSPIDGVVIARDVDVGQTVAASFSAPTLFTIANDLTKMQVLANVDEADIGNVKTGQDVSFSVDAYADQTFHGTVGQVRLQPIIAQNVVNYVVVINVPNDDKKLMPGMTATISVLVQKKDNVLKVSNIALRFQPPADLIETRTDAAGREQADSLHRRQQADRMPQGSFMATQAMQRRMAAQGIGRLWELDNNKKLKQIDVHVGLTDGTFTEVSGENIAEGKQIVANVIMQK